MTTRDALQNCPQDVFYNLLDRYNGGIEPLENWETTDLVDLELAVNAELQERSRGSRE